MRFGDLALNLERRQFVGPTTTPVST